MSEYPEVIRVLDVYRWRDSKLAIKGKQSWCNLTEEGIEYLLFASVWVFIKR